MGKIRGRGWVHRGPRSRFRAVRKTLGSVQLCGHGALLAFAARNPDFRHHSFRTRCGLPVAVHGGHGRDAKFLADSPPGQAFLITEPHNFVTAKHTLGSAHHFTGSLSGTNAG